MLTPSSDALLFFVDPNETEVLRQIGFALKAKSLMPRPLPKRSIFILLLKKEHGLFSVALSVASRPPAFRWYLNPATSGLSSPTCVAAIARFP